MIRDDRDKVLSSTHRSERASLRDPSDRIHVLDAPDLSLVSFDDGSADKPLGGLHINAERLDDPERLINALQLRIEGDYVALFHMRFGSGCRNTARPYIGLTFLEATCRG